MANKPSAAFCISWAITMDETLVKNPNLDLQQQLFLLQQADSLVPNKAEIKQNLLQEIEAKGVRYQFDFAHVQKTWLRFTSMFAAC